MSAEYSINPISREQNYFILLSDLTYRLKEICVGCGNTVTISKLFNASDWYSTFWLRLQFPTEGKGGDTVLFRLHDRSTLHHRLPIIIILKKEKYKTFFFLIFSSSTDFLLYQNTAWLRIRNLEFNRRNKRRFSTGKQSKPSCCGSSCINVITIVSANVYWVLVLTHWMLLMTPFYKWGSWGTTNRSITSSGRA